MNENLLQTVKVKELPDIGMEYKALYIHSFRRRQIRELVNKWFSCSNVDNNAIFDKIMSSMKEINIPQTPLMVSLLLWIIEKQSNFTPINEAALVEKFIETLLEKLNFDEVTYESLDYTNKLDYLSYLSSVMVKNNKFYFTISEIYVETEIYFKKKGFDVNYERFVKFFFDKGIFITIENRIYFRFACFLSFFIAKYMSIEKNKEFKEFILSEDQYLNYVDEIVYFTGLNRQDYLTLKLIEQRVLQSFKKIDEIIDVNEIVSIKTSQLLTSVVNGQVTKEDLKKFRLSNEEKDNLLENPKANDQNNHIVNKQSQWQLKDAYMENLELYSKIVKNSELLDVHEKSPALAICINKYCKFIGLLYKILFEFIFDESDESEGVKDKSEEELAEHNKILEQVKYISTMGMPLVMQFFILENVGSPKLKVAIEDLIPKTKNLFEKFMLVSLYSDMKLPQYFAKIESLITESSSAFIQELILTKLLIYNAMYTTSDYETEQIHNLIASIKTKRDNSSNQRRGDIKTFKRLKDKSKIISDNKQKMLLVKLKNSSK